MAIIWWSFDTYRQTITLSRQLHVPELNAESTDSQKYPDAQVWSSEFRISVQLHPRANSDGGVGMCLSDNVTPVRCSTDIWNFATGAQGVDPLMVAETAKSLIESVVGNILIILAITLGLTSLIMTMVLFLPLVFNWRHARNLHFLCIVMAGATSFFLFVEIIITKMGILGAIAGVTTTSLNTVGAQRGILSEAFLWVAWGIWLLAFLLVWWVRWWEILERREKKKAAKKAEEDKKKKAEADKKAAEAAKSKPMKPEDQVLQQMAAAQM